MPDFGLDFKIAARATLRCGLPAAPVGPENPNEWYAQAEELPKTRVTGWFGCEIGSDERDDDIQLWFYEGDHLEPKLRLVADRADLVSIYMALGKLIRERGMA